VRSPLLRIQVFTGFNRVSVFLCCVETQCFINIGRHFTLKMIESSTYSLHNLKLATYWYLIPHVWKLKSHLLYTKTDFLRTNIRFQDIKALFSNYSYCIISGVTEIYKYFDKLLLGKSLNNFSHVCDSVNYLNCYFYIAITLPNPYFHLSERRGFR
jgi:hypothetical protein